MLLIKFFEDVYRIRRLSDATESAKRKHRMVIGLFSEFLGRPAEVDDLTDEKIALARAKWQEPRPEKGKEGLAKRTAQSYASLLIAQMSIAWSRDFVSYGPTLKPLKCPPKRPVIITKAQTAALFQAAAKMPYMVGQVPASVWWPALFHVAYETGMRRGDLFKLEWENVDMKRRVVSWLAGKTLKFATRLISHRCVDALAPMPRRPGPIFQHPFCQARLFQLQRHLCCYAGLPPTRDYGLQALRRKHGDLVREVSGIAAASESLQHSSQKVTSDFYTEDKLLDFASRLPDPRVA